MISSILKASFVAAFVPQALAKLYITSPVAGTICQAGKPCNVTWNDDGTQPTLGQIGPCDVGLYIGSQTTQIKLQDLGSIDVSKQSTSSFNADPTVGGDSPLYFLRFTSLSLQDGTSNYNYESFSAKFELTGMTGTFNSTEQSLMTAPTSAIGSSTSSPLTATTPGSSPLTATGNHNGTTTSGTGKPTGTSSHSTPSSTSSKGAAVPAFASSSHTAAFAAVVCAFFAAAAF